MDLAVPLFEEVVARDRKLTEVLESRVSIRGYNETPISLGELAEFLYRVARTRGVLKVESLGVYDGADHPYPTGGMAGDLEVYVSVARCEGLEPGIYHYESGAHRLRRIADSASAEPLLQGARSSSGGAIEPQVLLTLTSRFARLSWKYDAIAYAATLKHVGVFYQTVYLVATSMGLGPCALGAGDVLRAAAALNLDWLVESSVGEIAIGSRPSPVRWAEGFTDMIDSERAGG
jgi:SagB-type dehydrogenase family enzyme